MTTERDDLIRQSNAYPYAFGRINWNEALYGKEEKPLPWSEVNKYIQIKSTNSNQNEDTYEDYLELWSFKQALDQRLSFARGIHRNCCTEIMKARLEFHMDEIEERLSELNEYLYQIRYRSWYKLMSKVLEMEHKNLIKQKLVYFTIESLVIFLKRNVGIKTQQKIEVLQEINSLILFYPENRSTYKVSIINIALVMDWLKTHDLIEEDTLECDRCQFKKVQDWSFCPNCILTKGD